MSEALSLRRAGRCAGRCVGLHGPRRGDPAVDEDSALPGHRQRVGCAAQPRRGQGVRHSGGHPPQPARRELHHRDQGGDRRLTQDPRSRARPAVGEHAPELGHRARGAVGHHLRGRRRELVEVDPVEFAAVQPEHPLAEHRVVPGPPGEGVVGGDQVHRASNEVGPHHPPIDEQARQRGGVELAQPRPEPDERSLRLLGLQATEVRDGVEDGDVGPIEQGLAGERRAVERPGAETDHVSSWCDRRSPHA